MEKLEDAIKNILLSTLISVISRTSQYLELTRVVFSFHSISSIRRRKGIAGLQA